MLCDCRPECGTGGSVDDLCHYADGAVSVGGQAECRGRKSGQKSSP